MKVYAMCSGSVRKFLAATLLKNASCALIVLEYIEFWDVCRLLLLFSFVPFCPFI